MAAQQRRIDLTHRALAELLAQRSVNPLVAGDHHQTGSAEVKAVYQGTARKALDQSMMDRVEVARIFARQAQQPGRFIDQQQVFVLIQEGDLFAARRRDKGIDNGGHQAARRRSGWR
jgi:hypothetical protein